MTIRAESRVVDVAMLMIGVCYIVMCCDVFFPLVEPWVIGVAGGAWGLVCGLLGSRRRRRAAELSCRLDGEL